MKIIEMSIAGGLMIVVTMFLRCIAINKLPHKMFDVLWIISITRLLIPFSLPSKWSLFSIFCATNQTIASHDVNSFADRLAFVDITRGFDDTVTKYPAFDIMWLCFIIGVVVTSIIFLVSFIKSYRVLRETIPLEGSELINSWLESQKLKRKISIVTSDRISTPLTIGIFRPKIIFPKTMKFEDEEQLMFVLTHELVHIKRFDNFRKIVSVICVCLHWFNPLVWCMYVVFNRDIEISCDEKVVLLHGISDKSGYALALVSLAEQKNAATAAAPAASTAAFTGFGKNAIQERVVSIMKIKKISIVSVVLATALIFTTGAVFATSPIKANPNPQEIVPCGHFHNERRIAPIAALFDEAEAKVTHQHHPDSLGEQRYQIIHSAVNLMSESDLKKIDPRYVPCTNPSGHNLNTYQKNSCSRINSTQCQKTTTIVYSCSYCGYSYDGGSSYSTHTTYSAGCMYN